MKVYDSEIFQQIEALEQKQLRSLSDLAHDPGDVKARSHFDERRAAILQLREKLSFYSQEPLTHDGVVGSDFLPSSGMP